jgi:hypothetical protein
VNIFFLLLVSIALIVEIDPMKQITFPPQPLVKVELVIENGRNPTVILSVVKNAPGKPRGIPEW